MHTEVDVPNPNYELVPGMYATVQIPLHTVQNVLTVPVQAVQASGRGQRHGAGGEQRQQDRETRRDAGLQTATDAEIVSGLNEKARLVVFGEQSQYKPANW